MSFLYLCHLDRDCHAHDNTLTSFLFQFSFSRKMIKSLRWSRSWGIRGGPLQPRPCQAGQASNAGKGDALSSSISLLYESSIVFSQFADKQLFISDYYFSLMSFFILLFRWHNHLNPDIKKTPWTDEEVSILIEAHKTCGNKWAELTKILPGRYPIENSCTCKQRNEFKSNIYLV